MNAYGLNSVVFNVVYKWYTAKVQLMSKLTLACGNTYVFYFCRVTQSKLACDTRVNFRVEHASYVLCTARDPSLCAA